MDCPKCHLTLTTATTEAICADLCTHCDSVWIGPFQLEKLSAQPGCHVLIQELDGLSPDPRATSSFSCPICKDHRLQVHRHHELEIDWCPICRGIYFDQGELNRVSARSRERAEATDDDPAPTTALSVLGDVVWALFRML